MKKIIFFTNYPSPYRVEFFNQLGTVENIDLTVLFLMRPEETQEQRDAKWFNTEYKNFNVVFCRKKVKIAKGFVYYPEVLEWAKKKFDHVIFGGYADFSFMIAMQYLMMKHIPYILEIDGGIIKQDNIIIHYLKHHFIGSASKYMSSGENSDKYLLNYGAKAEKIYRYPFTSLTESDLKNAERMLQNKLVYREKLGFSDKKYVLFVGRFIKEKGIDVLLEAASKMSDEVQFVLVGGLPTDEMKDYCSKHHIHNVEFPGFFTKSELSSYYLGADLFILPTRGDVWGLVINEAMAYGLPVITTDQCVAGLELVKNGENGYVIPADDSDAIVNALTTVLQQTQEMGNKSLSIIRDYSIENMVKAHIAMLV